MPVHSSQSSAPVENIDALQIMVDSIVDYAVFMLDTQGQIATWNSGAERIKGYKREEVIGKHFSMLYPPEALADRLPDRELSEAAEHGRYEDEGWRVKKDGSRFWANVVVTALRSPDGALIGFGKVTRDLTARRLNEEFLREAKLRATEVAAGLARANSTLYRVLDASVLSAIIAADLSGTITIFNRGAELMLGYRASEVIGTMNADKLYLPGEIERRMAAIGEKIGRPLESRVDMFLICQQEQGPTEWTFLHKNGNPVKVALSVSLILNEEGNRIGALGVASDVTKDRNARQILSAANARYSSVLEYTSDSIITIGIDWTILYGNGRAKKMTPDLVVGENYWTCFSDVVGTPLEQTLHRAMEDKLETSYEVFYQPYEKWFRGRIFPNESGITVFFSDITEEKEMTQQLAREQELREKRVEALSHMAGGLAHEISNPLAIIHARASNLKSLAISMPSVSIEEVEKTCDSIIRTSDRAARILRGLQGFGREAGGDPMESASMYGILEQCRELQETRFLRHKIHLEFRIAPGLPPVFCREVQIGQIVTNLLNNAFDAIDLDASTERWVRVTADHVGNTISVNVTDSGPGVDENIRPKLMEAFFTTKTMGLSMGVGLSLSRAIAVDHGGSLQLRSDTLNTCFQLILPVQRGNSI